MSIGKGIAWAAFWLAWGAVVVTGHCEWPDFGIRAEPPRRCSPAPESDLSAPINPAAVTSASLNPDAIKEDR